MLRFASLACAVPALAVLSVYAAGGDLSGSWPALVLLCLAWWLFLVQAFSGRDARAFVGYHRLRELLLRGRGARRRGRRRRIPGRVSATADGPRLAWSHDGWAEAENNLVGLDVLSRRFDVVAFGAESRLRGEPPVALEILPESTYGEGLVLRGLTELLMPFDVAWVCGTYEGTTLQALDARAAGGPAVVCYEWENIVANYGHVDHPIRRRALREVDHFCASSATARAVLELDGVEPGRISVVPPAVEDPGYDEAQLLALRDEARTRWDLARDDLVMLFIGRLVWQKGLHTIAAAAATLRHQGRSPVRWVIAGAGPYQGEAQRIVDHYEAHDAIRFVGNVSGRDRHLAYAAADGLVLPSLPTERWLEQFGRVIPEAFAFGLPVIGSASGAIPEVVGDAGMIVAPGDHLDLASAAQRLADPEVRRSLRARASARFAAEYAVDRYVQRVTEAIELALARRAAA